MVVGVFFFLLSLAKYVSSDPVEIIIPDCAIARPHSVSASTAGVATAPPPASANKSAPPPVEAIQKMMTPMHVNLSIITGWYGMNFVHMPELKFPWAYSALKVICAVIVTVELIIFKKKKLL